MREERPSLTAELVCWMRAVEQRRPAATRILEDPYSALFLSRRGQLALRAQGVSSALQTVLGTALGGLGPLGSAAAWVEQYVPTLSTYVVARHRFIDDALQAALRRGALGSGGPRVEQVVLLGAGYDTRAYRFATQLANVRLFEVDHPATGGRKARVAERQRDRLPSAHVTRVPIDFLHERLDERLDAAGFVRGRPTFVVWEGVSMYLTRKAVESTLETLVSLTAPGSELALDFWFLLDAPDLQATAYRLSPHALHFIGEPITFGIHPEDVSGFLDRVGLRAEDICTAEGLEQRYVRDGRRVYPANYVVHARVRGPR